MLQRNHPDRIQITFDDRRLVANAGLILPATLALRLGLPELVQRRLDLGNAPLSGIPQIKPPFLDIAPAGIPPNIIPHSKSVKCGLIHSNSTLS